MTQQEKTKMIEMAYQEFNKRGEIIMKRKVFKTYEAMDKFLEKLEDKGTLYSVYGTREI